MGTPNPTSASARREPVENPEPKDKAIPVSNGTRMAARRRVACVSNIAVIKFQTGILEQSSGKGPKEQQSSKEPKDISVNVPHMQRAGSQAQKGNQTGTTAHDQTLE